MQLDSTSTARVHHVADESLHGMDVQARRNSLSMAAGLVGHGQAAGGDGEGITTGPSLVESKAVDLPLPGGHHLQHILAMDIGNTLTIPPYPIPPTLCSHPFNVNFSSYHP